MKKMSQSIQTKKKGKFRTNVILTFLVISLVSLSATGIVSLTFVNIIGGFTKEQSSLALETQIQTNMEQTAQKTALVINQKLSTAQGMIEAAAQELEALFDSHSTYAYREVYYDLLFENDTVAPDPSDSHYDANYGLNVSWTYSSWYASGTDSTNYLAYEAANANKLGRVSNIDFIFKTIHDQVGFRWLYIAFADDGLFINYPGSILAGTDADRASDPYDPRGEGWYINIWTGAGDTVFVEPYYDEFDNVLLISIGKVVYWNGQPRAVISGDITIEDIREKIIDVRVLASGYAFLINSYGSVIAHPEVPDSAYITGLPELSEVESNEDGSPALLSSQISTMVVPDASGALRYTRDGEDRILVYTPVAKGDYICAIAVPLDEVLEAIPPLEQRILTANAQATAFILFVTVAGIVIAGIVAVSISNTVTRPLQYLMDLATRNTAARIMDRPLNTQDLRVDQSYISKDDEIGELARAFQGMLDSIKDDEGV
jgi:HAMP domain-containing protein